MDLERQRTLWLCRRTLLEMMRDRSFNVSESEIEMNLDEFNDLYSSAHKNPRILDSVFTKGEEVVQVVFCEEKKPSLKSIRPIIDNAIQRKAARLIMIVQHGANVQVSEQTKEIKELEVEIFREEELIFNVTKHVLVPKHRVMGDDEKQSFLKERMVLEENLPIISINDPVARYYGAKKGQLIEILRKSETAGTSYYYRIVK